MSTDGGGVLRSFRKHLYSSFTRSRTRSSSFATPSCPARVPSPRSPCSVSSQSSPAATAASTRHSARAGSMRTDCAGSLSPTGQSPGRRSSQSMPQPGHGPAIRSCSPRRGCNGVSATSSDDRDTSQSTEIPDVWPPAPERDPKTAENPLSGSRKGSLDRHQRFR